MKKPSICVIDGTTYHAINGKKHREDGPAVIFADGVERWYLNDVWIESTRRFCKLTNKSDEELVIMLLKYGESLLHEIDKLTYLLNEEITAEIDASIIESITEMAMQVNYDDDGDI